MLENLLVYTLQTTALIVASGLLHRLLRLDKATIVHTNYRLLLACCLLLPLIQPWQAPAAPLVPVQSESLGPILVEEPTGIPPRPTDRLPLSELVLRVWAAGMILRLMWLGIGYLRLRSFRRGGIRWSDPPPYLNTLRSKLGVSAEVYRSDRVQGPVTFGVVHPTILLPSSLTRMDQPCKESFLCHELLHIARRDWLFHVVEEVIRSVFWFHPAMCWLLNRIQLTREQVVDRQVLAVTGARKAYLRSLLRLAQVKTSAYGLPAPLFLQEDQLGARVRLILQEVHMSASRIRVSLGLICLVLTIIGVTSTWVFPLKGLPSSPARVVEQDKIARRSGPIRVGSGVLEGKLVHRVEPQFPRPAEEARVKGFVIPETHVTDQGQVGEVKVLRGHPLLNEAAMEAVRQWRYEPISLNGVAVPAVGSVVLGLFPPGQEEIRMTLNMDQSGILWHQGDRLEGKALLDRARSAEGSIMIVYDKKVPLKYLEETVELLKLEGLLPRLMRER